MYIKFKKNTDQLVQITDVPDGIPFPHPYFKFGIDNLPEQSSQWFDMLNNCIFTVIHIEGEHPKLDKYRKYLQKEAEPVLIEKVKDAEIKHKEKQATDKKFEVIKIKEEEKKEQQKEKANNRGRKPKKVISSESEIEEKVNNFLKI